MKISNTAARLKEIMIEMNLKQVDILKKSIPFSSKYNTKITKTDLSQYVSGKVEPGQAKLFVLANTLNVSEAWLMGYDVPRERDAYIITNHSELSNEYLVAIQILAQASGYELSYFANQYQIIFNDCLFKLSPSETTNLIDESIEHIRFVVKNIIDNKLKSNIIPIGKDLLLDAAHERTDIEVTEEMKNHDEDIMDDENF